METVIGGEFEISGHTIVKFLGNDKEKVSIPEGIQKIGLRAFACHEEIREITLPNSLKCIHSFAFDGCKNLSFIENLSNHYQIEGEAFRGCNISNFNLEYCYAIGSRAFESNPLTYLTFGKIEREREISDGAFSGIVSGFFDELCFRGKHTKHIVCDASFEKDEWIRMLGDTRALIIDTQSAYEINSAEVGTEVLDRCLDLFYESPETFLEDVDIGKLSIDDLFGIIDGIINESETEGGFIHWPRIHACKDRNLIKGTAFELCLGESINNKFYLENNFFHMVPKFVSLGMAEDKDTPEYFVKEYFKDKYLVPLIYIIQIIVTKWNSFTDEYIKKLGEKNNAQYLHVLYVAQVLIQEFSPMYVVDDISDILINVHRKQLNNFEKTYVVKKDNLYMLFWGKKVIKAIGYGKLLVIDENVESIAQYAFGENVKIQKLIIKGDIIIEENAFSNSNIEEIEFEGVSKIKEKCFADMHRLKRIYLGSNGVCIDEHAFMRTDSKIEYEEEIFGYGTIERFNMFYNPIIDIETNISSVDLKKFWMKNG